MSWQCFHFKAESGWVWEENDAFPVNTDLFECRHQNRCHLDNQLSHFDSDQSASNPPLYLDRFLILNCCCSFLSIQPNFLQIGSYFHFLTLLQIRNLSNQLSHPISSQQAYNQTCSLDIFRIGPPHFDFFLPPNPERPEFSLYFNNLPQKC